MQAATGDRPSLRALAEAVHQELDAAGLPGAWLDARLLVCAATGCDHAELIAFGERRAEDGAGDRLHGFVERRIAGEPVSRILGRREFWSLCLEIGEATLDPRADSEAVVEAALDLVRRFGWEERPLRICDLGTGSGCLLLAVLSELPEAYGVGVDISPAALVVARRNAMAHGLAGRVDFVCGDWLDPVKGGFDLVVANPPYIARNEIAELDREVRLHDPLIALDGGSDGLDAYRRIIPAARAALTRGGWLVMETGAGQAAGVEAMLADHGYCARRDVAPVVRDLAGRARCVRAVREGEGTDAGAVARADQGRVKKRVGNPDPRG